MPGRSVGLIILTELPSGELVAVLRERGSFNFEKMEPESWPGGCQVTVHGKLEDHEKAVECLYREMQEELGEEFAFFFWKTHIRTMAEVCSVLTDKKQIVTLADKVDFDALCKIRLEPGTGCVRFLRPQEIPHIKRLEEFSKARGVPGRETVAMFEDEKKAVLAAFGHFAPHLVAGLR